MYTGYVQRSHDTFSTTFTVVVDAHLCRTNWFSVTFYCGIIRLFTCINHTRACVSWGAKNANSWICECQVKGTICVEDIRLEDNVTFPITLREKHADIAVTRGERLHLCCNRNNNASR